MCLEDRPLLEPNAGGIDIGAREIFVAVPAERDENPVRVFSTFTEDLEAMARWVAGELWRHHGSDGGHGSILDSGLRCAGTTRGEAVFGGCPWHEERTGSAHGLARMPVAAIICIRSGCFERHFDWTVMDARCDR
jgi:hypothetical protein